MGDADPLFENIRKDRLGWTHQGIAVAATSGHDMTEHIALVEFEWRRQHYWWNQLLLALADNVPRGCAGLGTEEPMWWERALVRADREQCLVGKHAELTRD